jgi:hypothetical protein
VRVVVRDKGGDRQTLAPSLAGKLLAIGRDQSEVSSPEWFRAEKWSVDLCTAWPKGPHEISQTDVVGERLRL